MSFKDINKNIQVYILICFSLLLSFWLISIYEIFAMFISGREIPNLLKLISYRFSNHLLSVLIIFLIFLPLYLLLVRKKRKPGVVAIKVIFVLIIIIELSLTKYSLTTLLNLGADLLGYSFDDILITVTASESASFLSYLPILIFPLLFLTSCFFLKKSIFFKYSGRVFITISLGVIIAKFALADFSESIYQNKLAFFVSDIVRVQVEKSEIDTIKLQGGEEYPLLKDANNYKDVLGPFFNLKQEKPNIVMILVEGLGSEFVGDREFSGFTPYINSLISKSLFWDNFLSNTGRTFGALPSLTASLPFGEKGFLELEDMPSHHSLFSILKNNDYSTSFFSGDQSSFDKKIIFLEYNDVENIIDENKYENFYPKSVNGSTGFSWGYSDFEIFKKTLATIDQIPSPRFDLITTQTIHEPFDFPLQKEYSVKIDSILNSGVKLKATSKEINSYKNIFASILYADHSIKMFMEAYEKKPEYENTIFIISGDHRVIPIAQKDKLCRFNVPFIIYSPMLKQGKIMNSISSHFDVAPSLLAFLGNNYNVELPEKVAWLGEGIDTTAAFTNKHQIPLMRYKGTISDYLYKDYMYSDGKLYKIKEDFNTFQISDKKVLDTMKTKLKEFKNLNAYVTNNDKIISEKIKTSSLSRYTFSDEEKEILAKMTKGLSLDKIFQLARKKAFNDKRDTARLICNYLLKNAPNYVDVRILKGRTLAWDKQYEESELELKNAIKRSPYYFDSYLALLDLYWWSSQNEKSIELVEKAKERGIDNDEIAFKLARAYRTLNKNDMALKLMDSILKKDPTNHEYIKFKKSL